MEKNIMWKDGSNEFACNGIFNDFYFGAKLKFPEKCPDCGSNDLHVYVNKCVLKKHSIVLGINVDDFWTWCSNCKSYIHASYCAPEWWENCVMVNQHELQHEPETLEAIKDIIDEHVNKLLSKNRRT